MTSNALLQQATGTAVQLRMTGNNGSVLKTPDSVPLTFPDDIDIMWFGTVDHPYDSDQALFSQWTTTPAQRSWSLRLTQTAAGLPGVTFYFSNTGAGTANTTIIALPIFPAPDRVFGLRATRRRSDGQTKVYFSASDPPTWVLLLTEVTGFAGNVLFASTADLMIGAIGISTGTGSSHTGYFRRAELYNGYDGAGTLVASPNVTALTPGTTSFNDAQANPWTVSTPASVVARPSPGSVANDFWIGERRMGPVKDGYFRHGSAAGYNVILSPDDPTYNVTDIDVRWYGAIDWTTGSGPFAQWNVNGSQRAWVIEMGGGQARLSVSTTGVNQFASTLVNIPYGVGAPGGLRFTRVQSTGLTKLYFSTDGINWVENVAGRTTMAAGTAMFNSTADVSIGGYDNSGASGRITGNTYYAELRNGIDGPVVFRCGPDSFRNVDRDETVWTGEMGATLLRVVSVTGTPPHPIYPTVDPDDLVDIYLGDERQWPGGDGYVTLDGTAGTDLVATEEIYLSSRIGSVTTPDPGVLPTQCHIIMKLRGPNSGPAVQQIVTQWADTGGTDNSWRMERLPGINANSGALTFIVSTTGTTSGTSIASNGTTQSVTNDNEWLALAITTGASSLTEAYTSPDGQTWTKKYTSGSSSNITSWDSSLPVKIGGEGAGGSPRFSGRIHSVELRTGLVPGAGSTVWKFDAADFWSAVARTCGCMWGGSGSGAISTTNYPITTDVVITARCTFVAGNNAQYLANTWSSNVPDQGWWFGQSSAEALQFGIQGADNVVQTFTLLSTAEVTALGTGVVDIGVRFQLNSAGTCRAVALQSTDGGTVWNEIGTAQTGTVVTASRTVTTPLAVGIRTASGSALEWQSKIIKAEMRTGTDPNGGTLMWRFDPADYPVSSTKTWTDPRGVTWTVPHPQAMGDIAYTDPRSRVWTVAKNTSIEGRSYNTGNVGSCEVVVKPRSTWAAVKGLIAKWGPGPTGCCWHLRVASDGRLQFVYSIDGTTATGATITTTAALVLPTTQWSRLGAAWNTRANATDAQISFYGAAANEPLKLLETKIAAAFDMPQGTAPITVGSVYVTGWDSSADYKSAVVRASASDPVFTMDRDSLKVGRRARALPSAANEGASLDPYGTAVVTTPDPGPLPDEWTLVFKRKGPSLSSTSGAKYLVSQGTVTGSVDMAFKVSVSSGSTTIMGTSGRYDVYPLGTVTGNTAGSPTFDPSAMKPVTQALSLNMGNMNFSAWSYDNGVWTRLGTSGGTGFTMFDSSAPIMIGDDGTNTSSTWWYGNIYWIEMRSGFDAQRGRVLWRFDASEYPGGGVTSWTDPRGRVWSLSAGTYALRAIIPLIGDIALRGNAKIYPTVSEMRAKWGTSQWGDGTKWSK